MTTKSTTVSHSGDLKLSNPVQSVLSEESFHKSNLWLIETSFQICHELVTYSLEAAAALNCLFDGSLETVQRHGVGEFLRYGHRKGHS